VNDLPQRVLWKAPGRRPKPYACGAQEAIRRGAFLRQPSSLKGKCNLAMVLATAAEIAAGMAFLHARGIIHGDLSGGAAPRPPQRGRVPGHRGGRAMRCGVADRLRCRARRSIASAQCGSCLRRWGRTGMLSPPARPQDSQHA